MLVVVGVANTLWCTALLGPATGVGLFVLPCLALVALVTRRRILLLGIGLLAQQMMLHWPFAAIAGLTDMQQARLYVLNSTSVGMLLGFLALTTPLGKPH